MERNSEEFDRHIELSFEDINKINSLVNLSPKKIPVISLLSDSDSDKDEKLDIEIIEPTINDYNMLKKKTNKKNFKNDYIKTKAIFHEDLVKPDQKLSSSKIVYGFGFNQRLFKQISNPPDQLIMNNKNQKNSNINQKLISKVLSNKSSVSPFITIKHDKCLKPNSDKFISILSYNVMTQSSLKKQKQQLKYLLSFNRMVKVIEDLRLINSDIICLQEVDEEPYRKHLTLQLKNYTFLFAKNSFANFFNVIGFRSSKFQFISQKVFDLSSMDIKCTRGIQNIIIQDKSNDMIFSVYNVHFPWKQSYTYHRCYLIGLISEDIIFNEFRNVLISGDFNSLPNSIPLKLIYDLSFVQMSIENIVEKCVGNHMHTDINSLEEENVEEKLQFYSNLKLFENMKNLFKNYSFKSAYNQYVNIENDREVLLTLDCDDINTFQETHPPFTYYTENFRNTIDYIFYSNWLELIKIKKLPSKEEVSSCGFLPNQKFPSDHLMIFAEFKY
jgi:mRNA deadenylase 3'-5' endonuclease subunit Ccr4